MPSDMNWCGYFTAIEKDPKAITPPITVRQFYEARQHIRDCDACYQRTERVLAKEPHTRQIEWEKN